MVAPVVGRQEGRHGGKNPTRGRWFQGEMHPVDPALTSDHRAETLLTFPLNSYSMAETLGVVFVITTSVVPLQEATNLSDWSRYYKPERLKSLLRTRATEVAMTNHGLKLL